MALNESETWYWVVTGKGCGGVKVIEGLIVETCPYFRWMIGKTIGWLVGRYHIVLL